MWNLFEVNNKYTWAICEIYSKLTLKSTAQCVKSVQVNKDKLF